MSSMNAGPEAPHALVLAEALRHYWHPVARSDEVGDRPIPVRLLDEALVLWRAGEQVMAFYDLCIHRGTPLSLGWIDHGELVCAYHGWSYAANGACTRIPSLPPDRAIPSKARATVYRAAERHGLVWVCLGEPVAEIPELPPELDDPAFRWHARGYERRIAANAARMIENLMDFSHFAWVHPGLLGDRNHPECLPVTTEPTDTGFQFEIEVPLNRLRPDGPKERQRYTLILPFTIVLQRRSVAGPEQQTLFWICSPVSLKDTRFYYFAGRNFSTDRPPEDEMARAQVIYDQDRAIVEAQRPEELPIDLREELHLRGPDTAALEYRKLLGRIGVEWQ
jgi:phenylpropionate dioxygenase-like ring-hydroxylating dioxygenase large terminal subunit